MANPIKPMSDYHQWIRDQIANPELSTIRKETTSTITDSGMRLTVVVDLNTPNPTEPIPFDDE